MEEEGTYALCLWTILQLACVEDRGFVYYLGLVLRQEYSIQKKFSLKRKGFENITLYFCSRIIHFVCQFCASHRKSQSCLLVSL